MKKLLELLVGEDQKIQVILLMLVPALTFFVYIILSYPMTLDTIITAFLGLDIFSGLMSNLQAKTNQAWKKQSNMARIIFVVIHLSIYPLLIILFQISIPLMIFMLVMLLSKTTAFIFGSFK